MKPECLNVLVDVSAWSILLAKIPYLLLRKGSFIPNGKETL